MTKQFLIAVLVVLPGLASAQVTTVDGRERCATRLSSALLGKTPTSAMLTATDPQSLADSMIASADFQEKFARYINSRFNPDPGAVVAEDASYWLAKYVLVNNRPWKELFNGQYRVDPPDAASTTGDAVVVADTAGLGYFRSRTWMVRYAGNELNGVRIVTAYRMLNNVLGIKLQAAVNTDGIDATGRMAAACSGCHYNPINGLDLIASILSKRIGTGTNMTFSTTVGPPVTLLGGQTIANDAQFINAMVNSNDFKFRACRLAVEFAYARPEYKCEGTTFDACIAAFTASGTIQSAVAAIVKAPTFCQ
jgi:hypothetical protein